jgi:hypothetical protein
MIQQTCRSISLVLHYPSYITTQAVRSQAATKTTYKSQTNLQLVPTDTKYKQFKKLLNIL